MIPKAHLTSAIQGNKIVPRYLGENDHPWLRLLIEEYSRFLGRPRRELKERLNRPLPFSAPATKLKLINHLLLRSIKVEIKSKLPPQRIRSELFGFRAQNPLNARDEIIAAVSNSLKVTSAELEEGLFGDFPDERHLSQTPLNLSAQELALRANLMLVQSLIARSVTVRVHLEGNSRVVIQAAKRKGLICVVSSNKDFASPFLTLSGPLSLFRRTTLYGRALAELIPSLMWCPKFRLWADCLLGMRTRSLELNSTDPIFPSEPPPLYDSQLEENFATDFRKATSMWNLIRECDPIAANGTLIFPDFVIQHQTDKSQRWLLEIMGYWTAEYLKSKLERLNRLEIKNFILCLRDDYNCSDGELPSSAQIVRFKGRVDPATVLGIIENPICGLLFLSFGWHFQIFL